MSYARASQAPDLPTSSAFVTALLDSLNAHPNPHTPPAQQQAQANGSSASAAARLSVDSVEGHALKDASKDASNVLESAATLATGNVLVNAPQGVRKVLLTLHVLFPNELLPALDLLDRRLVMRFMVRREAARRTEEKQDGQVGAGGGGHGDGHGGRAGRGVGGILSENAGDYNAAARSTTKAQDVRTNSALGSAAATASLPTPDHGPVTSVLTPGDRSTPEQDTHTPAANRPLSNISEDHSIYHVRSAQHRPSRYTSSYDSTTSYEVRLRAWNCSCPAFVFSAFPSTLSEPPTPHIQVRLRDLDTLLWGGSGASRMEARQGGNAAVHKWRFGGASLDTEGMGTGMPPVCKHLLACVLVDRCDLFAAFAEEREIGEEEAAGWAAGWGD